MAGSLREGILTISGGPNFERQKGIHTKAHGLRRTRNFFYFLRSESKQIWILFASYSHVSLYSQTPIIRIIRFIFASEYSPKFAYKYSIWCKTNTFSHTGEYLFQNISFEANIRKSWSEFYIQANIRLKIFANKRIFSCKYSQSSEFSLRITSTYKG
jgi:hypothetical protein